MESSRYRLTRKASRRLGAAILLILGATAASSAALTKAPSGLAPFVVNGGPSVRMISSNKLEIRWIADFVGDGRVDVFENPNGGPTIYGGTTSSSNTAHTFDVFIGGVIRPDTTYYFKVTHTDPTGARVDLTNDPAPYPPFFTGAQQITNLRAVPGINSAEVSWDANVIGTGSIVYGTTALDQGPLTDTQNTTNHAFTLTGLTPDTVYQFKVSNNHAIDGGSLAEATGQFRTLPLPPPAPTNPFRLVQPKAEPRTLDPGAVSRLSVKAQDGGNAIAGAVVRFEILSTSKGSGSFGGSQSAESVTNADGVSEAQFTAGNRGNVHVKVTSPNARNAHEITVVVRRG